MTRVFFYHGAADKLAAACALLSRSAAQKKPILVLAPQGSQAAEIDRMLWTREALSFVPHCRVDSPLASETPIVIAERAESLMAQERLMNLGHAVPPQFERFASLIEVVGNDDEDRAAGRQRVRHYREKGCEVHFHDLSDYR